MATTRTTTWAAVCVVAALLVLAGCSSSARRGAGRPTTTTARAERRRAPHHAPSPVVNVHAVPLVSAHENAARVISRDIGVSVGLPDGHELWLFGDTSVYTMSAGGWNGLRFIDGSTALEAPYTRGRVPRGNEYPAGPPTRFIPVPDNVYMADGSGRPCIKGNGDAAFSARWPNGAAVMPGDPSEVLITYSEVCVFGPTGDPHDATEGWGYALYNWRTQRFDRGPVDVITPHSDGAVLPSSEVWGSPVFDMGSVTLFSSTCPASYLGCDAGQVLAVTVPATATTLGDPTQYRVRQLDTDGSASWEPLSISVGRYQQRFRLIEWTSIAGTYAIFSTSRLGTPWHLDRSGTLPGCHTVRRFCFALEGHPELSTPTDIFVSYVDPDAGPGMGHVVISALPG